MDLHGNVLDPLTSSILSCRANSPRKKTDPEDMLGGLGHSLECDHLALMPCFPSFLRTIAVAVALAVALLVVVAIGVLRVGRPNSTQRQRACVTSADVPAPTGGQPLQSIHSMRFCRKPLLGGARFPLPTSHPADALEERLVAPPHTMLLLGPKSDLIRIPFRDNITIFL